MYQFPWGINLSANFLGRQGFPNPYDVRIDRFDVTQTRPRILINNVDTVRYENVYQLDFRLEKAFHIGPVIFTPVVELFNATDDNAILQRYEHLGNYDLEAQELDQSSFFNRIEEVQSPRILRMGARISF